jgi:phenylacetate-CoA ligase
MKSTQRRKVLLIGPKVPPYGGMAIQGQLMQQLMIEDGIEASYLASNLPFPNWLTFLDRFRGVRPFLRSLNFSVCLARMVGPMDAVHVLACSWLYFFLIACPAVVICRIRGKRVILNYRGGEADAFLRLFGFILRPVFRLAHLVTAPSTFLVEVLRRRVGVSVEIVPNIVNLSRFTFHRRSVLQPKMIVTRHLLKLYDIESVIRAFGQVQKSYTAASLVIVGTGDQEAALRQLVAELKLRNVEFLGYVPQEQLPTIYERCDILLNASHADNFPGSLVEAAASGLVVVSTGAGGIPYIFENDRSAILVKVGDWASLAEGVIRVLRDPQWAERLSQEALQDIQRYDWKNIRRRLYSIYGFGGSEAGALDPGGSRALSRGEV